MVLGPKCFGSEVSGNLSASETFKLRFVARCPRRRLHPRYRVRIVRLSRRYLVTCFALSTWPLNTAHACRARCCFHDSSIAGLKRASA